MKMFDQLYRILIVKFDVKKKYSRVLKGVKVTGFKSLLIKKRNKGKSFP